MKFQPTVGRLKQAMATGLPGHDAFLELSGYKRPDLEAARAQDPPPRESAVLVLIYPKAEEAHTLLMLRPTYDGVHSGQVAFPGGRMEPGDPSLLATAHREFTEETGAVPPAPALIGALSPVYIPPSRSLVTPFLVASGNPGAFDPDPREVAELIEVPLEVLMNDEVIQRRDQYIGIMGRTVEIPYFDIAGKVVWGATAMMLAELRELLQR